MNKLLVALFAVLVAMPSFGSHLNLEQVLAMEQTCQKLRDAKLAPEKAAVLKSCLASGGYTEAECQAQAAAYGEMQAAPIRRPGKYYDLPECQKAYRARQHYDVNPGR